MSCGWLRACGRFGRRIGMALLWTVVLLAIAIAVNVIGIRLLGSITSWDHRMNDHASHFLAWRLSLYAGTIYAWMWLHQRLQRREPGAVTNQRLLRTEIAAVLALAAIESSMLL
jgi:hypothetical protein